MNVQADMSGHVSSKSGTQLPGASQQNGNVVPNIVAAGSGAPHATFSGDPDLHRARNYMQEKIFFLLARRHQQPINDSQMQKLKDIVKRLEEGLFKSAHSKDDYMNLGTLESRLHSLIKRPSLTNQNPVTANSMTTMIPTPGLSHNGSSTMMATSSVDAPISNMAGSSGMQPTNANTGSHMSSGVMQSSSFNRTDGLLSNGYQQAQANYSIGSGGNNLSQMGVQRMSSQMIPTPGFSNNSGNHSYGSLEASSNGGRMSIVDSPMVSQDPHQKLHVSNQNSRVLHALGSQTGGAIRSGIQQKSHGFANGALNGGLGMIGSNLQMSNGPSTSEGFLNASPYINSPKPLQHQFDQYQRSSVQGDVYGSSTDVSGPGNLYTAGTSAGPMANSQSMGALNLQSLSKTKASLVANPSNLHSTQQAAHLKPQSVDPVEKMNFQSALPSRENFIQSQHRQQFQQQTHYQPQQQFAQQRQHMQQNQQHQALLDSEIFGLPQVTSDPGNQFKQEPKEIMREQASDGIHLPEFQNQYQQNPSDNHSKVQLFAAQSNQHNSGSMLSQNTPQVQHLLQLQQLVAEAQNEFTCHPVGLQSDSVLHGQWHPQLQDGTEILGNKLNEQHLQDDFQKRISRHDEAQCDNLSSAGSVAGQNVVSRVKIIFCVFLGICLFAILRYFMASDNEFVI